MVAILLAGSLAFDILVFYPVDPVPNAYYAATYLIADSNKTWVVFAVAISVIALGGFIITLIHTHVWNKRTGHHYIGGKSL